MRPEHSISIRKKKKTVGENLFAEMAETQWSFLLLTQYSIADSTRIETKSSMG